MNFELIYQEHKNLVFNLALQYVQNREEAEEITQDVFLTVYDKMNSFREDSKFNTWIYRITINHSLDCLKRKRRKKRFAFFTSIFSDVNNEIKHDVVEFNHPGVLMEQKEEMEKLFGFINQLADNQKTALLLVKVEGKTQNEAAEIMQISPKAVESLVQRAKVKLSKKIFKTKENE